MIVWNLASSTGIQEKWGSWDPVKQHPYQPHYQQTNIPKDLLGVEYWYCGTGDAKGALCPINASSPCPFVCMKALHMELPFSPIPLFYFEVKLRVHPPTWSGSRWRMSSGVFKVSTRQITSAICRRGENMVQSGIPPSHSDYTMVTK